MTADPLPLTELLDQLERLVDGLGTKRPLPWHAYGRGIGWEVHASGEQTWHDEPCGDVVWDGFRETVDEPVARSMSAAVNLLRPMVEALRAAAEVDGREMYEHADQGDGFCDACEIPFPCSYADLRARLAALRDAAALELEEKSRG